MVNPVIYSKRNNFAESFDYFNRLRSFAEKSLCDLDLLIKDQIISVHRIVVASRSPFFQITFQKNVETKELNLNGLDYASPAILQNFVDYMYTSQLSVDINNVKGYLECAAHFEMLQEIEFFSNFIVEHLDYANCLDFLSFSNKKGITELAKEAIMYARSHFTDVAKTKSFLLMDINDVVQCISSDDLIVLEEKTVYESVFLWLGDDLEGRKQHATQLTNCIRFYHLPQKFLVDNITHNPNLKDNDLVQRLAMDASILHREQYSREVVLELHKDNPQVRPRKLFPQMILCLRDAHMDCLVLETQKWRQLSPIASLFDSEHSAILTEIENEIYLMSSYSDTDRIEFSVYQPKRDEWALSSNIKMGGDKRRDFQVAVVGSWIYALGGDTTGNVSASYQTTGEKYLPLKGEWVPINCMRQYRTKFGTCVINNRIYVFRGLTSGPIPTIEPSVEFFSLENNLWTIVNGLVIEYNFMAVGRLNGSLYLFGGENANGEVSRSVKKFTPIVIDETYKFDNNVGELNIARYGAGLYEYF